MTSEQAEHLVDLVAGRFESRDDAHAALRQHGLCDDDAEYILDMIDMAHSRSVMSFIGVPMGNMHSNVDDDPVFQAAVRRFLPAQPAPAVEVKRRPWWKFW